MRFREIAILFISLTMCHPIFSTRNHVCACIFIELLRESVTLQFQCRGNFDTTKLETETLMNKMLEVRGGMVMAYASTHASKF